MAKIQKSVSLLFSVNVFLTISRNQVQRIANNVISNALDVQQLQTNASIVESQGIISIHQQMNVFVLKKDGSQFLTRNNVFVYI